jgi:hypothetical protein
MSSMMSSLKPKTSHPEIWQAQIPQEWEKWVKGTILTAAGLLLLAAVWTGVIPKIFRVIPNVPLGNLWYWSLAVYGMIHYAAMIWRICLWLSYRPMPPIGESELPTVSVIIPAYNEGSLVRQSIDSVTHSDYPRHKLQVIAVDDGSSDDTWEHIRAAASESPIKVITLRQPVNKGKRHALFAGFQKATGEVWVTVDSDSVIEPDALRNGVVPLVRDKRIGLVAGNVRVLNRNDSVFTRFLKVSFILSFTFSRAYQTQIRGLLTTPGALSIYRASAVKPVLEKWMNQTFLGVPCLTGEDRSMTNLICAQGYHSFFQSTAVVWAKMPATYQGMAKMFLRWARSNIRETWVLLSYLFKPFRTEYLWGFRSHRLYPGHPLFPDCAQLLPSSHQSILAFPVHDHDCHHERAHGRHLLPERTGLRPRLGAGIRIFLDLCLPVDYALCLLDLPSSRGLDYPRGIEEIRTG